MCGCVHKKIGKSSQNSPIQVLIFCGSMPCVFSSHTSLNVVSHYDFSVLFMAVMGKLGDLFHFFFLTLLSHLTIWMPLSVPRSQRPGQVWDHRRGRSRSVWDRSRLGDHPSETRTGPRGPQLLQLGRAGNRPITWPATVHYCHGRWRQSGCGPSEWVRTLRVGADPIKLIGSHDFWNV